MLIHANWHGDQEKSGKQSIMQDEDWIRQEIATALNAGKTVIPLLIDGAYLNTVGVDRERTELPEAVWLPEDIRTLFAGQCFRLRFDDRPERLEKFLSHLRTLLSAPWSDADRLHQQDEGGYFPGVLHETFPLPDDLQNAPPTSPAPYVGLRPFRREDARLFYGRSREIYDLCYKLTHWPGRLLLLDGYSGTGKSSLLQAGLIPRLEAQGWAVAYARREDDKIGGLPGLLKDKRTALANADGPRLIILDQVEEVLTNPILSLPHEVATLIDDIVNALEEDPDLRVILGFRSEFSAHLKRELAKHAERPQADSDNTLYALDRRGLVEAIRGVSADRALNGPGKPYQLRFRPSKSLPETIADRLIDSKAGCHVAPLLQVNMELLWQKCLRDDGVVEITGTAIRDFIDNHEDLLDHYVGIIRRQVTAAQMDDQRLLELLNFYVEEKPASALRADVEFEQKFANDSHAPLLRETCKQLYLLYSKGTGEQAITRLSHDSLAEVIYGRYSQLTEQKVVTRGEQAFEAFLADIEEQVYSLQYRKALDTLDRLMTVEELRRNLYPWFFELTFFWNEAGLKPETERVLQHWSNSGLLTGDLLQQTGEMLTADPDRSHVRAWLARIDPGRYRDMQTRYLAPEQTVMVSIPAGEFLMGDETGDLGENARPLHSVELSSFWLGNTPVTWWQLALSLFASQREQELKDKAPSWGLKGDHPVVNVDWYEAVEYCNWLSQHLGLIPAHEIEDAGENVVRRVAGANGFRLPTEAQWEYACRAGSTTKYWFGNDAKRLGEYAWFEQNGDNQTHPVGSKQANDWGLFDMHGNVWEWCHDWHGDYGKSPEADPAGPDSDSSRVLRGGSCVAAAVGCRSAFRGWVGAGGRSGDYGFRVCLVRSPSTQTENQ